MGHLINYITVVKKKDIYKTAVEYALDYGDSLEGSDIYHGQLKILESVLPIKGIDNAREFLEDHYEPYHDLAVRYIDIEYKAPTKAMIDLKNRMDKIEDKINEQQNKRKTTACLNRIKDLKEKYKSLNQKYKEAKSRNVKNNGTFWLLKVEIHV